MRNQQIRLTESDLHFIVEESVRNVLIQEGFFGNIVLKEDLYHTYGVEFTPN